MKNIYSDLFRQLVYAYENNSFDEKIEEIFSDKDINKIELANVVSSLCGTDTDFSKNYINELKTAIKCYTHKQKIVTKVRGCSMNCADEKGETLCQKSCPFSAILEKDNSIYIDKFKCTDCGLCIDACPNGNILDKVEFLPLIDLLKQNIPIIAAVAPAISGQFGNDVSLDQLRTAFMKLGFTDMVEVAFFADMLTLKEAVEFDEHVHKKDDLVITSCCCPMWVAMVKRVYNNLVKYITPSVSPMIAAGRVLKALHPECKVVFIGPCVAKKAEAKNEDLIGDIDFVLTFEELKEIFNILDIIPSRLSPTLSKEYASKGGRLYARTGGVTTAVFDAVDRLFPNKAKLFTAVQGNGVKECKDLLNKAQTGKINANFVEGMGCVGGCVGGPKAIVSKEIGTDTVNKTAENSQIKVAVDSTCMNSILNVLDINSVDDFKNHEKTKIFHRDF